MAVIVIAVVWGAVLLLRLDVISSEYETFGDLQESESWQKGWAPSFVPRSATDIVEEHDLDTNSVWGEFSALSFSPEEDVEGSRMLDPAERQKLLKFLPIFGMRQRIGDRPVFRWCSHDQGMSVHFFVTSSGRVIYWGDAAVDC